MAIRMSLVTNCCRCPVQSLSTLCLP